MQQPGQVSVSWPQEQAEKPRNPPGPLGNSPELPRAIPSSRSALTADIIFKCDRRIIPAPSLEMFMARLHGLLSNRSSRRCACPWEGRWNWMVFNGPSNPNHFIDSMISRLKRGTGYSAAVLLAAIRMWTAEDHWICFSLWEQRWVGISWGKPKKSGCNNQDAWQEGEALF